MKKQGFAKVLALCAAWCLWMPGGLGQRVSAEEAGGSEDTAAVDSVCIVLQALPEKGGAVSGGRPGVAGDTLQLVARPAQDWHFVAWTRAEDTLSKEATCFLPVTEDMAALDTLRYTACFEHDPLAIMLRTHLTEAEPITMNELYAYRLEAGARVNDEADRITGINVFVNEVQVEVQFDAATATVRAWYTPEAFGETVAVRFEARSENGLTATLQRQLKVVQGDTAAPNRTVRTMDKGLINFPTPGQTNGGVYALPQYVGHYQSIIAHLDVACPTLVEGGKPDCDDWDRVGWIEVQTPDGQWREIIRYITSYRKPCNHTIDVTEFASFLQGEVPIRMYIETWGTGGWEITLDFEYVSGPAQFLYSEPVPLWNGVFPFGDPARLQPLDTVTADIPDGAVGLSLRIVTTGHGWGENNTGNAAEFYEATHKVLVNDTAISQLLWMTCYPNPDSCQPQSGTWRYDRAGWCPGVIAPGFHYNLSGRIPDGQVKMAYVFDETYVDLCHPNNPDCVSGKTCTNCSDSYNPMYYIASYLVYWYDRMYEGDFPLGGRKPLGIEARFDERNLSLQTWPNPTADEFYVRSEREEIGAGIVQVIDAQGRVYMQRRFSSAEDLAQKPFSLAGLPAGMYIVRLLASDWYMGSTVVVKQ